MEKSYVNGGHDSITGLDRISISSMRLRSLEFIEPEIVEIEFNEYGYEFSGTIFGLYCTMAKGWVVHMWIEIISSDYNKSENNLPNWNNVFFMIIDGKHVSLKSDQNTPIYKYIEFKNYDLPVDVLNLISNAKMVEFSLRGQYQEINGNWYPDEHIKVFKIFEDCCIKNQLISTANEKIAAIIDERDKQVNASSEKNLNASYKNNKVTNKAKNNISDNKIDINKEQESIIIDLLKNNKVSDSLKYVETNLKTSQNDAGRIVKGIAEKSGLASVYKKHEGKETAKGCGCVIIIIIVLMFIVASC
jgi:hypothetical protein